MDINRLKKMSYFKQVFRENNVDFQHNRIKDEILSKNNYDYRKAIIFVVAQLYIFSTDDEFEQCLHDAYYKVYPMNSLEKFISHFGNITGPVRCAEARANLSKSQFGIKKADRLPNQPEYWIKRGYDNETVLIKVKETRFRYGQNAHVTRKLTNPGAYRYNNKVCIEYWEKRYPDDVFNEMYTNYMKNEFNLSPAALRNKLGEKGYIEFVQKRKIACREGFIKKGYSYTSKLSLKHFVPIYKYLRKKYKISPDDIYWGIGNQKEYFLLHTKGYPWFYDFVLPKHNIVIEFNGNFFHPKSIDDINYGAHKMKNGLKCNEKYEIDQLKLNLAKNNGFKILELWDTESITENFEKAKEFIDESIKTKN